MTRSQLFTAAHALARKVRQVGDDYRVTFGACLRYVREHGPGVVVESRDRLSNKGLHRCGGGRSGHSRWWLRGDNGFVDIPSVRGDERFSARLDLAPGRYVLGTGAGRDAIRQTIVVA